MGNQCVATTAAVTGTVFMAVNSDNNDVLELLSPLK